MSSTEAEYFALFDAVKEAIFLSNVLKEIIVDVKSKTIIEDNQDCIPIPKSPVQNNILKHVSTKHQFIVDLVDENKIPTINVYRKNIQKQKAFPGQQFEIFNQSIGLICQCLTILLLRGDSDLQ